MIIKCCQANPAVLREGSGFTHGGDEFAVVLPKAMKPGPFVCARIKAVIDVYNQQVLHEDRSFHRICRQEFL
jgi:hypothetical protein